MSHIHAGRKVGSVANLVNRVAGVFAVALIAFGYISALSAAGFVA